MKAVKGWFGLAVLAALFMPAIACAGSGESVVTISNTAEVIRTPAPTPSLPSIMRRIKKSGEISEVSAAHLGLGDLKVLPESLTPGREPLRASVVEQIWTDWLSDSKHLIIDKGYEIFEEYCGDGTRIVLSTGSESSESSATYNWAVEVRAGGRWNVGTLIYDTDKPPAGVFATPTRALLDPQHTSEAGNLVQGAEEVELLFFENPECGQ